MKISKEVEKAGQPGLVPMTNYNLVTFSGELALNAAEELDGLGTLSFDRVKIPAGGMTVFEIPGEEEDQMETLKSITGVIVHHRPMNAYWAREYSGGGELPDCSSMDGETGVVRITGEVRRCQDCRFNQYGSAKTGSGRGKACKNIHLCYILQEGNPMPLVLQLPPTSLRALRDYVGRRILLRGLRTHMVVTEISLKKEKGGADGVPDYSRAVFSLKGVLDEEQLRQVEEVRQTVQEFENRQEGRPEYTEADAAGFMDGMQTDGAMASNDELPY